MHLLQWGSILLHSTDQSNENQLLRLLDKIRERQRILAQQRMDIQAMESELTGAEERCLEALENIKQPTTKTKK